MKRTSLPAFATLLLLFTTGISQEPELRDAQVTIPYTELKELLHAVQERKHAAAEAKPPVESALSSASYRLDFSSGDPTMTAEFEVRTFTEDWHGVPLFRGAPKLESQDSDETASVILRDDLYTLVTRGSGSTTSRLVLTIPAREDWTRGNGLRFAPAAAARNILTVSGLPAGMILRIDSLEPIRSVAGETTFSLPVDGREIKLFLEEGSRETRDRPVLPSSWTLDSQILAKYSDGRIKYSARIQTQTDSGSGLSATLALPANASKVRVEGEDLADWKLAPRGEGLRRLEVNWETRDTFDRELLLEWDTPQSPLSDTWTLTPPTAIPAEESSGNEGETVPAPSRTLIALVPVDGLELSHPSLQTSVEARRLPEWLQNQLGNDDSITLELDSSEPVNLTATWLPRMETAQATISQANFDTRLVEDGSMLVTADYTIRHDAPLNWQLTLPSSDQILTCRVNQKAFNPIQRPDKVIEFRLPTPGKIDGPGEEPSPENGTTVHLSYALKAEELDPVSGRVALELPETDLFIHHLDWDLAIPGQFEPTAVEGNVQLSFEESGKGGTEKNLIRLEKKLCRGERPAVEIHYQSKDLTAQN